MGIAYVAVARIFTPEAGVRLAMLTFEIMVTSVPTGILNRMRHAVIRLAVAYYGITIIQEKDIVLLAIIISSGLVSSVRPF